MYIQSKSEYELALAILKRTREMKEYEVGGLEMIDMLERLVAEYEFHLYSKCVDLGETSGGGL